MAKPAPAYEYSQLDDSFRFAKCRSPLITLAGHAHRARRIGHAAYLKYQARFLEHAGWLHFAPASNLEEISFGDAG